MIIIIILNNKYSDTLNCNECTHQVAIIKMKDAVFKHLADEEVPDDEVSVDVYALC